MNIDFKPVWFDSLGAKSSCTLVRTPDVCLLIDPGVAVMHPSFPASWTKKLYWYGRAELAIKRAAREVDVVIISHYHYDHFTDFDPQLYEGKLLLAKNPNEFINDSQRGRAKHFFDNYCRTFGEVGLGEVLSVRKPKVYGDPLDEIPIARDKDFGDYNRRRKQLFRLGAKWFGDRAEKWNSVGWIPELEFGNSKVKFAEGKSFAFGHTKLRFTEPLFHGIEFSRVGWVFATVIEFEGEKLLHSSDLNGPIIEDYADWIVRENPNVLILDGAMTYMLGYTLTRTTLNRTIENAKRIIEESDFELMIYDHHLPREPHFRERTREIWETARSRRKRVLTVAELLGKKPVVLKYA